MDRVTLGARIYEARKKANLTSEALAEMCDCTPTTIRAIESGARLPSVPKFVSICNALKVTPNHLLMRELLFPISDYDVEDNDRVQKLVVRLQRLPGEKMDLVYAVVDCLVEKMGNWK